MHYLHLNVLNLIELIQSYLNRIHILCILYLENKQNTRNYSGKLFHLLHWNKYILLYHLIKHLYHFLNYMGCKFPYKIYHLCQLDHILVYLLFYINLVFFLINLQEHINSLLCLRIKINLFFHELLDDIIQIEHLFHL